MIQSRPTNHVTAARDAYNTPAPRPLPEVSEALLKTLEALYPPRCLEPRETVEDHLRYAGKAELVAYLRDTFEQGRKVSLEDNDLVDAEHILRTGERAT